MRTTNARHNGFEPVPLQGAITRARTRQFQQSSWTENTVLRSVHPDGHNFCIRTRIATFFGSDLKLCPCKVQSQELVHVNSSRVRGPKTPFCVAFAPTAITFAYELGLRRSLARWKANEKLHLKIAKTSSTPFRRAFRILPCRCETCWKYALEAIIEMIIFHYVHNI